MKHKFKALYLFCGIGGGALGFQEAEEEYKGIEGSFETICGIDCDPEACQDFQYITGSRAECMDLFSREQYISFHGKEPYADWREVTAADIKRVCDGEYPDVVFTSPPCKGLLDEIKKVLKQYGYAFSDGYHDCGEIGDLAQHRKRYLLICRNVKKLQGFVYEPPVQRVKAIGEVLEELPMPDDINMSSMHRLPRLQWKTWVRLALIPAGGDWRDLENNLSNDAKANLYRIQSFHEAGSCITGAVGPSNGATCIADPRIENV